MARNSNATTITDLIHELEALDDILSYIEIREKDARQTCKEYMEQFAETEYEYWREEALEQDTKADTYAECKKYLLAYAIS